MKDRLIKMMDGERSKQDNLNLAREYLQHYVLYVMYREKMYLDQAFLGGTALRIIYGTPRFSEDLDFSLIGKVDSEEVAQRFNRIASELALAGYEVKLKSVGTGNVRGAFLKFNGLPYELGLSPHPDQVFALKVEVDCNPPQGGNVDLKILNRYHLAYSVRHHDLSTLFARKLNALLFRKYSKARDVYDLFWFLSTHPGLEPNVPHLNNAVHQVETHPPELTTSNWRSVVMEKLQAFDLRSMRAEILPFLERPEEAELLTQETFVRLLDESP